MYYIKYVVTSSATEVEQKKFVESVETTYGVDYSELDFIDKETMSVKIRKRGNDRIEAIILRSPDYLGLTYRIAVDY